eukprot:6912395-Prymnesium_polylepis.1
MRHRGTQHPDDDPQILEPASRHGADRSADGALRERHRTNTYSPLFDTYLVPEAPRSRVAL